jgi:hypothetical protein
MSYHSCVLGSSGNPRYMTSNSRKFLIHVIFQYRTLNMPRTLCCLVPANMSRNFTLFFLWWRKTTWCLYKEFVTWIHLPCFHENFVGL